MNASLIKYQCLNVFVTICLFIAELISRLLNAFVIFNVRMLTAVLTNVSKSSHKSTWILFGFSDCFELNETYSLVDDFTWNIRPISWKTRRLFFFVDFNLISQVSVRFFFGMSEWCRWNTRLLYSKSGHNSMWISNFDKHNNFVTFFYFLWFFCYFSQNNRNPWENNFFCVSRRPYVKPVNFFYIKMILT